MTHVEAKRIAKRLLELGHYGINIVTAYPEGDVTVTSYNRAGMYRTVKTQTELRELTQRES